MDFLKMNIFKNVRVRDLRRKEKFFVDDDYLNGYAKICGWRATLVYLALCRHANKDQECFPSIVNMAEKLGVSSNSIRRGIQDLLDHKIIHVERGKSEDGKWLNNTYILLDKSLWLGKDVIHSPVGALVQSSVGNEPPPCGEENHRPVVIHKDTNKKDTHRKGQSPSLSFQEIIDYWNSKQPLLKIETLTDTRRKHLVARATSDYFLEKWRPAIDRIAASAFCCGKNDRGWRADFDWFISNDTNFIKALEGKYDNKDSRHQPSGTAVSKNSALENRARWAKEQEANPRTEEQALEVKSLLSNLSAQLSPRKAA